MQRHHAGNAAFNCVQNQLDVFHSSVCLLNEMWLCTWLSSSQNARRMAGLEVDLNGWLRIKPIS